MAQTTTIHILTYNYARCVHLFDGGEMHSACYNAAVFVLALTHLRNYATCVVCRQRLLYSTLSQMSRLSVTGSRFRLERYQAKVLRDLFIFILLIIQFLCLLSKWIHTRLSVRMPSKNYAWKIDRNSCEAMPSLNGGIFFVCVCACSGQMKDVSGSLQHKTLVPDLWIKSGNEFFMYRSDMEAI